MTVDSSHSVYVNSLALVAHELRSPASIVSGYLRLLQQDADGLTERQRRMTDEAARACTRMLRLIQEIGELTTLEGSEPARAPMGVRVFDICDQAVKSVVETNNGSPAFTCAESDRPAIVDGNPAWLKRAFEALTAATARELGTEPLACHGFVSEPGELPSAVIVVGPHGVGDLRDAVLTRRDPFDVWRGGTGLSLPIACRIIEAHGGQVWSPAGNGARASAWTLPIAPDLHRL
jgi:signal transduction histidine kinase